MAPGLGVVAGAVNPTESCFRKQLHGPRERLNDCVVQLRRGHNGGRRFVAVVNHARCRRSGALQQHTGLSGVAGNQVAAAGVAAGGSSLVDRFEKRRPMEVRRSLIALAALPVFRYT